MKQRGITPHAFQRASWEAWERGESGLIQVPTGSGKTWASTLAPLASLVPGGGLQLLYLTPLRALSRDIEAAIREPTDGDGALAPKIQVESRTGDTSSAARARQKKKPPEVLITTPESLCLMLCDEDAWERLGNLKTVVVDEWHELCGSKRGTQVELALARVRSIAPRLKTWGLSATISEIEVAAQALVGLHTVPTMISAKIERPLLLRTLVPSKVEALRQAGHSGMRMLPPLLEWLDPAHSTLIFTNTRSQAERWFQALSLSMPEWEEVLALHHGSLERPERERVEAGLKDGSLRIVVCTSTLDLGVDFGPVDRVVQLGSPKGIARLMQRAGRSGHRPGASSNLLCVPTHLLEILEFGAAREAIAGGRLEPRPPVRMALDVLVQHLVTCAAGGGFEPTELFQELRSTVAYSNLSPDDFDTVLRLVRDGGILHAYPDYQRITWVEDRYRLSTPRVGTLHRTNIGTIVADASISVKLMNGKQLGTVEEGFAGKLKPGDQFIFAGRRLELVRFRDTTAHVRPATRKGGQFPAWGGGRFPISASLADALRRILERGAQGHRDNPEMEAADLFFRVQSRLSHVPAGDELLAETWESPEGFHLFLFPFEGRLVHEGLAALLALRFGRIKSATFQLSASDHGIEFLCPVAFPWQEHLNAQLFRVENLSADILESANLSELARRQFREIARIAGFLHSGPPGKPKSSRQIQSSAGLLWEVFSKYDPENILLQQARREVLERHFEQSRLAQTLRRLSQSKLVFRTISQPGPLSLPLLVERALSAQTLSTESLEERISRIQQSWD